MKEDVTSRDGGGKARFAPRLALGTLVALAVTALVAPCVNAAKPPSGGGGTGGGTIYYESAGGFWSMTSSGSGKTLLPVVGVPSRLLHGDHRWFLQRRAVAGAYPNGSGRSELFAVRGDGNESFTKQLTDSPVIELWHHVDSPFVGSWLPGDAGISEIGREWDADAVGDCANPPYPEQNPCVVDGGIYQWTVLFDANGNVAGLPADAGAPIVVLELSADGNQNTWPSARTHDWSPNAAEIVHDVRFGASATMAVHAVVVASGVSRVLTSDGRVPRWSPDGAKVKFNRYNSVLTISPDGTGLQQILSGQGQYVVAGWDWSPTGSHVTYYRYLPGCGICNPIVPDLGDVYRATASGGSKTNLTGDVSMDARPADWR